MLGAGEPDAATPASATPPPRGRVDSPRGDFPAGKRRARRGDALEKRRAEADSSVANSQESTEGEEANDKLLEAGTWTSYVDASSGDTYYCNDLTGRATWTEKPVAATNSEVDESGRGKSKWTRHTDEYSRREYFCNTETGRSTWTDHRGAHMKGPKAKGVWTEEVDSNSGKTVWVNTKTGRKTKSYPHELDGASIYKKNDNVADSNGSNTGISRATFDSIQWNRNPNLDIQGPCPGSSSDLKMYGSEGSAAHSLNEVFVPFGGVYGLRCYRCCCCCCPVFWPRCAPLCSDRERWRLMWPCWSHNTWVRAMGVASAIVTSLMLLMWLIALAELARLGICVATENKQDECFQIQRIHVSDLCGEGGPGTLQDAYAIDGQWNIPVSVRVTIQNPGTHSWLGVGPVSSEVHVVQDLEAEKDGVEYQDSFKRIGSVIEKHAFSSNVELSGPAAEWNHSSVGTVSDGFAQASSNAATVAAASSNVAWLPGGNFTTLVELLIRMDETTGAEAAGHCVSSQMNDEPFAVAVTSVAPVYIFLWPFSLPLSITLNNEYRCERFPQPNLSDGTKVKDRYECGLSRKKREAKAKLVKESPKPKILSVGMLKTPEVRENISLTVDVALYLGLEEISVNAPSIDVDVRWGDQSSSQLTFMETNVMNTNASGMPPIVHVRTSPTLVQHGEVMMTMNMTLGRNNDEHTSENNIGIEGGAWSKTLGNAASEYQLSRLQTFAKQFLKGYATDLLIRGPFTHPSDGVTTELQEEQHFKCFARQTLAQMTPDIKISIQNEDMEDESKCPDANATQVISFHELFFEGINRNTLHMYMNSTIGMPFQVWGDVPVFSLEVFADSMSPLDPLSNRPDDIAVAEAARVKSKGVRVPLSLAKIESLPINVPFQEHIAPHIDLLSNDARKSALPLDVNSHQSAANRWWKLPIDTKLMMPYEDLIRRMVGVNNISDIDLRLTGSKGVNLISEVLSESFEFRMNKLTEEDLRCNGMVTLTQEEMDQRKADLNVALTSDESTAGANINLIVKYYPVPFAISSRHLVLQIEDNHTKWLDDPSAEQAWIARAELLPFRLGEKPYEENGVELVQDPVLIRVTINASDNGNALAKKISSIVDGYDTNLVITDAEGRIYNDYDVIVDKPDARGVIQVRIDPAKLFYYCGSNPSTSDKIHAECENGGEGGPNSASNFTIVRPKSLRLLGMTTLGTRIDLPCLFLNPDGCDTQLPSGPTKVEVETMTLLLVDGGVFPINLHVNLPKIMFDISRTLHPEAKVRNASYPLPESEWTSILNLELAEGSYSIDSTSGEIFEVRDNPNLPSVELKLNEFVTMQKVRIENLRTALDTIDHRNNGEDVTLRFRTAPSNRSLFDSIVSKLEVIFPLSENTKEQNSTTESTSVKNSLTSALNKVRSLSLDVTSDSDSVSIKSDVRFEMPELPSGMNITIAGGEFSLYSEGIQGSRSPSTGSARDALDYCAISSNQGTLACHVANISWPETGLTSQMLANISFSTTLFSPGNKTDRDFGKLLGQMTSAALAGEANILSFNGEMYSTNIPTHAKLSLGKWQMNSGYIVPVNSEIVMMHVLQHDSSDNHSSDTSAPTPNSASTQEEIENELGPIRRVNVDSISSKKGGYFQSLDLPCLLGSNIPRCYSQSPQSISVTTTVFLELHRSLPLNDIEISITVPKLDVSVSVIFTPNDGTSEPLSSESPMAELGRVQLSSFGIDGQRDDLSIGVTTTATLVNSNTVRELKNKNEEGIYNITYVLKGEDPNAGSTQSSLLQKLAGHLDYRVTVPSSDSSSSDGSAERKSLLEVVAGPQPSVDDGVQMSARLKLDPSDLPEWMPPVTCAGFSAQLFTNVANDGSGGTKAASIVLEAFTINSSLPLSVRASDASPGDAGEISLQITMVGDSELTAMQRVVTAMRNSDGTFGKETIKLTGSFLSGVRDSSQIGNLEGLFSIGAFNLTSAQHRVEPVINETKFEIHELHLVGGSDVGADVRIPCIFDPVCTDAVNAADLSTSYTFAAIYSLNVPASLLPCPVTAEISGVQFALEDNTRQQFIRAGLKASHTLVFDSRTDSSQTGKPYEVLLTLNVDDGKRARDVIRSIGGREYRMYLHGDTELNGLGKLWKSSDSISLDIDGETSNPNAEENIPTWYLPLHEENTWKIRASSSSEVRFRMNFPLNWPLPFPLHIVEPSMVVTYQIKGKPLVTIASAETRSITDDSDNSPRADLYLRKNETNQGQRMWLRLLSSPEGGSSYCDPRHAYVDRNKCAIGKLVSVLISQNAVTPLNLVVAYRLPTNGRLSVAAGAGKAVKAVLGMNLFDQAWNDEFRRQKKQYELSKFAILPPGPPVGEESPYKLGSVSELLSGIVGGSITGDQYLRLALKFYNPFAFPLVVTKLGVRVGYEDQDGIQDDLGDYPARTMANNAPYGNVIGPRTEQNVGSLTIEPGTAKFTPFLNLKIDNLWSNGWRLYTEYDEGKRVCLHVRDGLVDLSLFAPGSATQATPFLMSLPFDMSYVTTQGDNDCVRPSPCNLFSDTHQNAGEYRELINLPDVASAGTAFWQLNGDAGLAGNYLRLSNPDNDNGANNVGTAFTKSTYDLRDSFELKWSADLTHASKSGCFFGSCAWPMGHSDGYSVIFTTSVATSKGSGGNSWGQGYVGIPGKSFAIAIDTYSEYMRMFRNVDSSAHMNTVCNNPLFSAAGGAPCTKGYITQVDYDGSGFKSAINSANRRMRVQYNALKHTIFFAAYINSRWHTFLQAQVNFEEIFGSTGAKSVRVGFGASTGNHYYDEPRISDLKLRVGKINAVKSRVLEDGRVVGAVHDENSKPFILTIDGRDVCGYDRAVGGESVSVTLKHKADMSVPDIRVPGSCGATESAIGTCEKTVVNGGSHPPNQPVGGLYEVKFLTQTPGFYDVELTAGGTTAVIGSVYVAD